jgi:hypothetical protein
MFCIYTTHTAKKKATNKQTRKKEEEDAYDKYVLERAENPHLEVEQYACCAVCSAASRKRKEAARRC